MNTQDLIIIGIACVLGSEQTKEKMEKEIQDRILNLSDAKTTILMQNLQKWNSDKFVMDYTRDNIGKLVMYGNSNGWDVKLNIEVGHDYHIVGEHIVENGVDIYHIYGIHNEFEEWASLLNIHSLVDEISNEVSKQHLLTCIENMKD